MNSTPILKTPSPRLNHYASRLDEEIRRIGRFDNEAIGAQINDLLKARNKPSKLGEIQQRMLGEKCLFDVEQIRRGLLQEATQLRWEVASIQEGVEIVVEDMDLLECILRTEVDSLAAEVHFPFPICEFAFPDMEIGDGCRTSGCMFVDEKVYRPKPLHDSFHNEQGKLWTTFLTTTNPVDSTVKPQYSWLAFDRTAIGRLTDLVLEPNCIVGPSHKPAVITMLRLCFGLLLYFQTKEGEKALEITNKKFQRQGAKALIVKRKKRKTYIVRDLITRSFKNSGVGDGTHASPKPHWRKLHMRTLRAQRYYPNQYPPKKFRTVWVSPARVNARNQPLRGQRKLSSGPAERRINNPAARPPRPDGRKGVA